MAGAILAPQGLSLACLARRPSAGQEDPCFGVEVGKGPWPQAGCFSANPRQAALHCGTLVSRRRCPPGSTSAQTERMTNRKTSGSATEEANPCHFHLGTNLGARIKNLFRFNSSQKGLSFKDTSFMGSKNELHMRSWGGGRMGVATPCQLPPVLRGQGNSTGL